jgi:hypothetical protein
MALLLSAAAEIIDLTIEKIRGLKFRKRVIKDQQPDSPGSIAEFVTGCGRGVYYRKVSI